MIIEKHNFNQLGATLYDLYLCMKYLFSEGQVRVIQWHQEVAKKWYVESLKLKRVWTLGVNTKRVISGIKLLEEAHQYGEAPSRKSEKIWDLSLSRKSSWCLSTLSLFVYFIVINCNQASIISLKLVRRIFLRTHFFSLVPCEEARVFNEAPHFIIYFIFALLYLHIFFAGNHSLR